MTSTANQVDKAIQHSPFDGLHHSVEYLQGVARDVLRGVSSGKYVLNFSKVPVKKHMSQEEQEFCAEEMGLPVNPLGLKITTVIMFVLMQKIEYSYQSISLETLVVSDFVACGTELDLIKNRISRLESGVKFLVKEAKKAKKRRTAPSKVGSTTSAAPSSAGSHSSAANRASAFGSDFGSSSSSSFSSSSSSSSNESHPGIHEAPLTLDSLTHSKRKITLVSKDPPSSGTRSKVPKV